MPLTPLSLYYLIDERKRSFFQAAVVSILLYGCTTWTQTKRMEKKLDGNYTRMLRAILNKSWRQTPQSSSCMATYHTSRRPSTLDKPDMWDTAGEVRMGSYGMYSCRLLHMGEQRQDDQLEPTYSSAVPIRDVALRTCRKQWTIGRGGERGSGISVLIVRHDDDDDDIYKCVCVCVWVSIVYKNCFSYKVWRFSSAEEK